MKSQTVTDVQVVTTASLMHVAKSVVMNTCPELKECEDRVDTIVANSVTKHTQGKDNE